MEKCEKCSGRGSVKKDGRWVLCDCKLVEMWRRQLEPLLKDKVVELTNVSKMFVSDWVKKTEKETRLKYYIDGEAFDPAYTKGSMIWYKSFLAYYLVLSKRFVDFAYLEMRWILDSYMGNYHGENVEEGQQAFYGITAKTLIIHVTVDGLKVIVEDALNLLIELYGDRDIIVYFEKLDRVKTMKGLDLNFREKVLKRNNFKDLKDAIRPGS